MNVITYNLGEAIEAAKAILPHTSTDDVTPVLMGANITPDGWYATDRYTLATYQLTTENDFTPFVLPREAIEWVAKIVANKLRHKPTHRDSYQLVIEHNTPNIVVTITYENSVERAQSFQDIVGNYPPVERLIANWKPAIDAYSVRLAPKHIEKVTSYVRRAERDAPVEIELGNPYSTDEIHKPAPVRFTYGLLTAIIQPNLKL